MLLGALVALTGCPETTTAGDAGRDAHAVADDAPGLDAPGLDAPVVAEDAPSPDDAPSSGEDAAATGDSGSRPDAFVEPPSDGGMCMDLPPPPTRPSEVVCSPCRPPGTGGGGGRGECTSDADCTAGTNGRCGFGRIGTFCSYDGCFRDSDCAANEACMCDGAPGGGNTCVPAGCRTNNDCAPGFACSPTFGSCGHYFGFIGFECHTAADECTTDAECGAGYCAFDPAIGHWACSTSECVG